jgi:mercuric ion binding protein
MLNEFLKNHLSLKNRNMKNLLFIVAILSFTAIYAQKKESKVQEVTFKVDGVCGDCEKRIEASALRVKGVKVADWDKKTKDLKVVYNTKKADLDKIQLAVSGDGHDTPTVKADSTTYAKLPNCCRYRDGANCSD